MSHVPTGTSGDARHTGSKKLSTAGPVSFLVVTTGERAGLRRHGAVHRLVFVEDGPTGRAGQAAMALFLVGRAVVEPGVQGARDTWDLGMWDLCKFDPLAL